MDGMLIRLHVLLLEPFNPSPPSPFSSFMRWGLRTLFDSTFIVYFSVKDHHHNSSKKHPLGRLSKQNNQPSASIAP
jgi:hypothetical protein